MRKWLLLAAAGLIAPAFAEVPIYTLGSPRPAQIRDVSDPAENVWLASNAVFVATAGFSAVDVANEQVDATGMDVLLVEAEIGFSWERAKPEYYLSDRIDAPANVDWNATYNRYCELTAENGGVSGFLFNTDGNDPGIFAITGGSQTFEWILQDGSTNKMTYTVAMSGSGRPRRIYWTDSPYNAPPISLSGKFVKFMGNAELLTLRYGTETNITGGVAQETKNKIVSGLYVDPESQVLYAAGQLSGQCVMVYYDTGSYSNILAVQVVEVRKPEAIARRGVIGEALRPDGQGYSIEGLVPRVATGIGDATDNRGNYLYQHTGRHSYSPKHNAVFPLRPTVGERWLASIYWMETDAMGVQWPFEYDQYENDWPKDGQIYVRGDVQDANGARDYGAKIHLDKVYTAELQKYQEPEGHAMAVEGDNSFYTKGEGWSLLRLEAEDNIWFLPIHSILRSNTDYYTLKSSRITVGRELTLRSGSRSGTSSGAYFSAVRDIAGYIYKPVSAQTYDVNLYYENQGNMTTNTASSGSSTSTTKAPSAIYAIAADGKTIEVWWSERARIGPDAPAEITVPVLPQVYRPIWPEANEMPQIVIASQQGSANETIYQQNGAAYFDRRHALLRLADRRYFPAGEGTISFWTRTGMHDEGGEETINQPSALMWLGLELESDKDSYGLSPLSITVETNRQLVVRSLGEVLLDAPMPAVERVNEWTHIALTFNAACATLYLDGEAVTNCVNNTLAPRLAQFLEENIVGANPALAPTDASAGVAEGREVAEIAFRSRALTAEEIASSRYTILSGKEANLTGYYTFRMGIDLNPIIQNNQFDLRSFFERVHGEECGAINVAFVEPGAPARGTGVIVADATPKIYRQNDPSKPGYNPNEEHALILSGSGGYVTWALRTDLNEDGAPPPAAFVEYTSGGRSCLQMYEVVLTNDVWKTLGADCTAGRALPGPHPFDIFENPWLEEDFWDSVQGKPGVAYRDRKGQIWARAAGTLGFHKYYALQDGFDFPQLTAAQQPDVGDPIPWLALLDRQTGQETDPLVAKPATWTWNVLWPENVPEMRIGQTLTTAADGLPEVWNAKSMAVVYPDPNEAEDVVLLTDPTVMQSVPFAFDVLQKLGFSTDKNGGLTTKGGKYYFTELPPHLSKRLYFDSTNGKLCFIGERESSAAGATLLYPNVLSRQDRDRVLELVSHDVAASEAAAYATWGIAVNQLARCAVRPSTATIASSEIRMVYAPVDHYALTAMGGTNYVTLIENDATNAVMGVTAGDPINMHVFKVVPKYYKGRIVTREDEINLLSQQLTVLYTEAFGGEADGFDFEWRKARPNADGTVPSEYDELGIYSRRYDPDATTLGHGNVRLTIGEQGDTLANMVNTYWICRYRATTNSPAYRTMGSAWSEWCAPPALAEGWVQRVLNNITPFNQRMTDL